jgi:uncharacterized membrane protein YgcG
VPPTTVPPTTVPPTTVPPTTVPPTTVPPVIPALPRPVIRVSQSDLRPTSVIGVKHLGMYASYGDMTCKTCHNGLRPTSQLAPPVISGENLTMGGTTACGSCHNGRREFTIFVAKMQPVKVTSTSPAGAQIAYGRCSDSHTISSGRGSEGGEHSGGGEYSGGGYSDD